MNTEFVKRITQTWIFISLLLVGGLMYLVGNIDGSEGIKSNITIQYPEEAAIQYSSLATNEDTQDRDLQDSFVASKNGKRYYTPGCSGIDRIIPENRIYFQSIQEAEATGRTIAKACQ